MEFSSLEELKTRLEPALTTKVSELKRNNIFDIDEDDIWNYFKEIWANSYNLTIYSMVNDILKCDPIDVRLRKYTGGSYE